MNSYRGNLISRSNPLRHKKIIGQSNASLYRQVNSKQLFVDKFVHIKELTIPYDFVVFQQFPVLFIPFSSCWLS